MAGSDKTEAPTPKRKKEARRKGDVAKSHDLTSWASFLIAVLLVRFSVAIGTAKMVELAHRMGSLIEQPSSNRMLGFLGEGLLAVGFTIAPIAAGMMVTGVLIEFAQSGLLFSTKRITPDLKRMNPGPGLKRMFSVSSAWELAKAVAKVAILFLVVWPTVRTTFFAILSGGASLEATLRVVGNGVFTMLRNVAIAGLVLGAVDYAYQWRRHRKQLRMTKQEVRDEHRNAEGDPAIRNALRQRARALSQNRMLASVGESDVVLVNPTHYAVALRYRPERGAPEVVAKGTGFVAQRIRAEAERTGVPIVADVALTRTIHRLCEIGWFIPAELYEAVARVLAFVVGVRQRGFGGGVLTVPGGSRLDAALAAT